MGDEAVDQVPVDSALLRAAAGSGAGFQPLGGGRGKQGDPLSIDRTIRANFWFVASRWLAGTCLPPLRRDGIGSMQSRSRTSPGL